MAKSGRVIIVSNFRPRDLLDIAKEVAYDIGFGLGDLDERLAVRARRGLAKRSNFVSHTIAEVDIEIFADRTKSGDGRLTLDWVAVKEIWIWGGGGYPETWAKELADGIEERIEDDGGKVLRSREE